MTTYTISYKQDDTIWTYDDNLGWVSKQIPVAGPVIGTFSSSSDGGPDDTIWDDFVAAGDTAVGTVESGAFDVYGTAANVDVTSGGYLLVESGGVASAATVSAGDLEVLAGGTANATSVGPSGYLDVYGIADGITLDTVPVVSGGTSTWYGGVQLESSGEISGLTDSGGFAYLYASATLVDVDSGGYVIVESGGTVTGMTVSGDGDVNVLSGGSANTITVQSGGYLWVQGHVNDTTVESSGQLFVSSGGEATFTTIQSGGVVTVVSGGEISATSISPGATLHLDAGFIADSAAISAATYVGVASGVTLSNFVMADDSDWTVDSGGSATSVVVTSGSYLYLSGTATDITIDGGGTQFVGDLFGTGSATATSTTIESGGYQEVNGGSGDTAKAINTTIESGGNQFVGNEGGVTGGVTGTAISTTIEGGAQILGNETGATGTAIGTTIESGGNQDVGDWDNAIGYATSTTIDSGGTQYVGVKSGATGTATSTTIESGGTQYIGGGAGTTGTATSTWISGGEQVVSSGGTADDDVVYSGGLVEILSGGSVNSAVFDGGKVQIDGGTLQLAAGESAGTGVIDFTAFSGANGGTLDLTGEGSGLIFTPVISGFTGTGDTAALSDVIKVTGRGDAGDKVVWTQSGASGTLQVETSGGTVLETLTLDGTYYQSQFVLTDPAGVDKITYNTSGGSGSSTLSTIEYIGSGSGISGSDSGTTIVSGGVQYLGYDYGTGTATSTTVESGGYQYVGDYYGTGSATSTTLSGGAQYVAYDGGVGTVTSTTIDSGGYQLLGEYYGIGSATDTIILSNGQQTVGDYYGTGTATSTTVSGGDQIVGFDYGVGTATDTTIYSGGGGQIVGYDYGTGSATSTTINGGEQTVAFDYGIGAATVTTIDSGGEQIVGNDYGTGTATLTTIDSAGSQYVGLYSGTGYASSTTIDSGGTQYVADGSGATGTATSTTLSGGAQYVSSGGTATDTAIYSGGLADILSGGVVNAPVIDGGTLELAEGASFGTGVIDFAAVSGAHGGTLDLTGEGSGLTFAPVISGFIGTGDTAATSDIIEVLGVATTDHVVWKQDGSSGTLQVETSGGKILETLTLDGTYSRNDFKLTYASGVDKITYDSNPLCYCRGARILTEKGEVAIERLAIGDRVVTVSGELKPIRWIGHRRVDIARHPRPEWVRPVRIEAGALGDNLPARDLLVSPEHALWLRNALVPARELINGATIRQEAWSRVEYFHLELDSHEILLAEGVAAESYLDCDNRQGFDNAPDGVVALHPDWRRRAASRPFAPSAKSAALRAEFAARALALGRGAEIAAHEAQKRARGKVTRTNFIRNPRAEGGVRGVLGAGGRAPTHWRLAAPDGIAIEVLGAGEEAGLPFLDLRFAGQACKGGHCAIQPEPGKAAMARPGQEWTFSCYLRLVGGGFDGVAGVNLYIDERGANGAYLAGQDFLPFRPTADDLALQRVEATRRMSRPDVAGVTGYAQIKVAAGAPIDLTLRVAGPQIERGHYASDLILPPPGQMRPSSRDEAPFAAIARRRTG